MHSGHTHAQKSFRSSARKRRTKRNWVRRKRIRRSERTESSLQSNDLTALGESRIEKKKNFLFCLDHGESRRHLKNKEEKKSKKKKFFEFAKRKKRDAKKKMEKNFTLVALCVLLASEVIEAGRRGRHREHLPLDDGGLESHSTLADKSKASGEL